MRQSGKAADALLGRFGSVQSYRGECLDPLQVFQPRIGDLVSTYLECPQLLELAEVLQAIIVDSCSIEFQMPQPWQALELGQGLVDDLCVAEFKSFQPRQFDQVSQSFSVDLGVPENQLAKIAQRTQMLQVVVRNVGCREVKSLQPPERADQRKLWRLQLHAAQAKFADLTVFSAINSLGPPAEPAARVSGFQPFEELLELDALLA